MDLDKRDKLEDKKLSLKTRLLVEAKVKSLENWWLNWFKEVQKNIKSCELICLEWVQEIELPFWDRCLNHDLWKKCYDFTKFLKVGSKPEILELLMKNHPGVLPLRYLPDGPVIRFEGKPAIILSKIIDKNNILSQTVYLFLLRMSPIVKVDLYELMNTKYSDAIFPEEEDMVIMSLDGNWIIFKSLEGEWVYRNSLEIQ